LDDLVEFFLERESENFEFLERGGWMIEWLEAGFCLEYVMNTTAVNYRWHQRQLTVAAFLTVVNYRWELMGNFLVSL